MKTASFLLGAGLAFAAVSTQAATYYVSPSGSDSADGSKSSPWKSLTRAQTSAVAGDTVYVRGGTYTITAGVNTCASQTDTVNAILLNKSGKSGSLINYWAYSGEVPVFDFSGMKDDCRVKGINLSASYVSLKGLEIKGVPQGNYLNHESWGVWIYGSYNVLEQLNVHHIQGTGVFLQNGAYNQILNTDSHHNYDPKTSNGAGQSGDGFGAHVKANNPGNIFSGCRAWSNSDDGFDLINAYSAVTIENSWAWLHGYLPGTTTSVAAGNGNGFKVGGFGGLYVANAPVHTVRNSVAFSNKVHGFYANHHPVANYYYNNTSYMNGIDFNMLGIDSSGGAVNLGILRNNIAYGGTLLRNMTGTDMAYNTWNLSVTVSDDDFKSVSTTGWDKVRKSDGSLPSLNQLHLSSGSDLINAGTNVGLSYKSSAPDLGAFER